MLKILNRRQLIKHLYYFYAVHLKKCCLNYTKRIRIPGTSHKIVELLEHGGVIIYPTDTVYGMGCNINKARAVERVARIKGIKPEKARFSFICSDLSHLSDYARHVDNTTFKMMKSYLPGPYTFILNASNQVPKSIKHHRKTVGIRIPDNNIILEIVRQLGHPILTTSLKKDDQILEYPTDPELIYEEYRRPGGCGH